ncbi:hypothetical protein LXA43DRAFT_927779, partial [Ganoderma leucocontextum]
MPPKPRPIRKPTSTAGNAITGPAPAKDAITSAASTSMPPPPDPTPPLGILEAEITALSSCLRTAVVKKGQIYGFYTDVKRLGIQQYAPKPPRSLTSALGREIVKYDQVCDAMESHLLRAISVLHRDLAREEQRIKAEEEAAAAAIPKPPSPVLATGVTPPGSPPQTQTEALSDGSVRARLPGVGVNVVRRQSTISLSSLSRPAAPHKLDLSASALRIHPDELIPSGLSSPVTLAPRSARAPSMPPDPVMAALNDLPNRSVDIDLTVDGDIDMTGAGGSGGQMRGMVHIDPAIGSSADKPIELDLDMDMDVQFFPDEAGAGHGANANMFGPAAGLGQQGPMIKPKQEEQLDLDLLGSFQSVQPSGGGHDIFASLGNSAPGGVPASSSAASINAQRASIGAPSPGTMLAGLTGTSQAGHAPEHGQGSFDFGMPFDSNFLNEHGSGGDIDMSGMDDIFNMGVHSSGTDGVAPSGSGTS